LAKAIGECLIPDFEIRFRFYPSPAKRFWVLKIKKASQVYRHRSLFLDP